MKKPIEVFSEWALNGKDKGMEKNHANPVEEMLNFINTERNEIGNEFSFLDLGCGNGWVVAPEKCLKRNYAIKLLALTAQLI